MRSLFCRTAREGHTSQEDIVLLSSGFPIMMFKHRKTGPSDPKEWEVPFASHIIVLSVSEGNLTQSYQNC